MANQVLIAERNRTYVHRVPYLWGGATPRGWDCSGAVNYVTCHDIGYNIPGYRAHTFTGRVHGPSTYTWLAWGGIAEIPRSKCADGTLVIWPSHMGVAVGANYYVSAYDTQLGTVIEPIHGGGPQGEVARFFNLRQGGAPVGGGAGGGAGGGVGGPVPGGNPQAGKQWNAMQAEWSSLRHLLGPGQQQHIDQVVTQIGRAGRISRS